MAEVDADGGSWGVYYFCEECRGLVPYKAEKCTHCFEPLNWKRFELKKEKKISRWEQTEPAE
jgi:ribosomal protein L40E